MCVAFLNSSWSEKARPWQDYLWLQSNVHELTQITKETLTAGIKKPLLHLPFMRHSHYLNVSHISRDLLNSIYYNVMFGLNGKSMKRQARRCWDHTKAISKLTYGGPMWLILTAVRFLIPFTASSLTLRHRLAVYLQTAKWVLVSFFFSLIFSIAVFLLPLFSKPQGEQICWIRYVR